ncbi:MAG TPA: SCO family protein [Pyrinomonadaceae bacterium]|nr:SCO family protein [Pyrinomonadaceae bacterium]
MNALLSSIALRRSLRLFNPQSAIRTPQSVLAFAFCLLFGVPVLAQYGRPPMSTMPVGGQPEVLKRVDIEQRLNEQVPLDIALRDEAGREVRLGEFFKKGRPVILSLVYYECPMMCNEILNGQVGMMSALGFDAGREFEAVTVSFDARETPEMAARKKQTYVKRYARQGADEGWHFLTGSQESIDRLTRAVGFNYTWDEKSKQFAHASAIMVVTPEGKLSHYFYGVEFPPKDVRLSLVEASANKIGSPVDRLMLYCYHYDPTTGKYGPVVMNILRVLGVATVAGLVGLVLVLRRRERRRGGGDDDWDQTVNVGGAA